MLMDDSVINTSVSLIMIIDLITIIIMLIKMVAIIKMVNRASKILEEPTFPETEELGRKKVS